MAFPLSALWYALADSAPENSRPERTRSGPQTATPSSATLSRQNDRSDEELVERIRTGDRDAFEALYLRLYPTIFRFAVRGATSVDHADDIVQDVFVDLWMRRTTLVVQTSIVAYVMGAIRNALRHRMRHAAIAGRVHDIWHTLGASPALSRPIPWPDEDAEHAEIQQRLANAIAALPPRQRLAMLLHWQDGLTSGEIADVMEVSDRVARKFLSKGLETLRRVLRSY